MDIDKFQSAAIALLGTAIGWQTKIARLLKISDRTVRKWLQSEEIPDWVEKEFAKLMGLEDLSPYPRDAWIVGDSVDNNGNRREYIYHAQFPRFIARIVALDEDDDAIDEDDVVLDGRRVLMSELPVDLNGVVNQADEDTVFCEIDFIDHFGSVEAQKWLEAAADYLEKYNELSTQENLKSFD